jgi:hypothetical protein
MSSYVSILIADTRRRTVVASCYVGGNAVVEAAQNILRREPDHIDIGFNSWGRITADEMREIIKVRYANGLSPERLTEWLERFPPERYLWWITRDY